MPRIVAIDYGTKRTGLAVTDPMKIIATPLETVHSSKLIEFLKTYDLSEGIESFVVGMPKTLKNIESENARHVHIMIKHLKKAFPEKEVFLVDERFTSSIALDAMLAGGMSKKNRRDKSNVDKISATIILQSFLEMKK
ncbi:Holliday junction resolvase RuvX [Cytophagaceae bacterium ABcell3]|nr:Holliday junction resolvase RuvX [Cytophagaceae bacterium ABcell3]